MNAVRTLTNRATTTGQLGESRTRAWGVTLTLVLLYVVNQADKAVMGLIAQPLSDELGLSASQFGLAASVFFAAFVFSGFFTGALTRWMSLRVVLIMLSLVWAATMLPIVWFASLTVLLVCRFILGLFEGPSSALIHTAAYSWHPQEKRGLPGAWIAAASSIAKIAVIPVLAFVVATWGWRAAFITLAGLGVAWCVLWLSVWSEGPYGASLGKAKEKKREDDGADNVPLWTIVRTRTFLSGLVAVFAMYALVSTVLTWLPSYFEVGLGYSRLESGAMFGIPSIVGVVAMFASTAIGDRLITRGASSRTLRGVLPGCGLLICGFALASIPFISSPIVAVIVVSVGYGVGSIVFPLINASISQICPPRQLPTVLGIFLALMATGGLVGPYMTGAIVDAAANPADGYATALRVFGIMALIGGTAALTLLNPERDQKRIAALMRERHA